MIRLTDHHGPRLLRMAAPLILPALGEEIQAGAQSIVDIARHNINDGAISGPGHVPSAPGEYPKSDTHDLEQSLHVGELIATEQGVTTSAIADSDHAAYLELGTSRMAARPFMVPSTEEVRPTIIEALGARYAAEVNS